MNVEFAYNILDILQTMWDAAKQMEKSYAARDMDTFYSLSKDLSGGLAAVQEVAQQAADNKKIRLADACICAMESLKDIGKLAVLKPEKTKWKLAYELEPIIETAAMQFYYWGIVKENPEKWGEFQEFLKNTEAFELLREKKNLIYQCDLVIQVMAYNHLDYTIDCVESILKNLPEDIRVELQLYNHGSDDGTKAYFESIENANVLNIAVNWALPGVTNKSIARGKYYLLVSNDILIGKDAIANIYRCAEGHADYGYIVPTTPAVSNGQTIFAAYTNNDEFEEFAEKNNVYDPRRHEQRVRLCNPLCLIPSLLWEEMTLDMYQEIFCNENPMFSFPDDRFSLWMRRHGYKNMLVKDAFCHHYGSVTLKEDYGKCQKLEELYEKDRVEFQRKYGIDPWGTGSYVEQKLFDVWNLSSEDDIYILGLNCGMGSNSLKVKEVLREKGAQRVTLYNGTQEKCFLPDLRGVSDHVFLFSKLKDIISQTGRKNFHYIVVDDPVQGLKEEELIQKILAAGIKCSELAYKKADGQWVVYILRK
ncbi:hypothetical protein AALA90_12200 [Lachnospiraceae bacterium 38-10]